MARQCLVDSEDTAKRFLKIAKSKSDIFTSIAYETYRFVRYRQALLEQRKQFISVSYDRRSDALDVDLSKARIILVRREVILASDSGETYDLDVLEYLNSSNIVRVMVRVDKTSVVFFIEDGFIDKFPKISNCRLTTYTLPPSIEMHGVEDAVIRSMCAQCGLVKRLHTCGGCGLRLYCGRSCQHRHWSVHKLECHAQTRM